MKMLRVITLQAGFLLVLTILNAVDQDSELGEKQKLKLIRTYYDTAIQHFSKEEYGKAIKYWEQILKLDPEQIQPNQLIAVARSKMLDKNKKLFGQLEKLYNQGDYTQALKNIIESNDLDTTDPVVNDVKNKLDKIVSTLGDVKSNGKSPNLIRNGLALYISDRENKAMLNRLIYASQLESRNGRLKTLVDNIIKEYPKEAKTINLVPGMDLVEQKLNASLNHIYDAKYDQAILECNEVLEIEPDNIMAYKRLGSAYFALGKKSNAKQAWQAAYKLNPKDSELKEFLSQ